MYVVSNLAVFGVISAIENKTGKVGMDDYDGLHKSNPWLSFAMTLAMFSLAGIPPFAGFFSKFLIFTSVTASGSMPLYMLCAAGSVDQYDYIALLLSARGEGHLDQSRRSKGRGIQKCIYRETGTVALRRGIVFFGLVPCIYDYCVNTAALL